VAARIGQLLDGFHKGENVERPTPNVQRRIRKSVSAPEGRLGRDDGAKG
jgi:hypothetical protein